MKTDGIEGLFDKTDFDEAYTMALAHHEKMNKYESQGAVLYGPTKLDQEYSAYALTVKDFQKQFTEDELHAIIGKALMENKEIDFKGI